MLLISNLKTVCKYLFSFAFGKGSKFADYLPIRGHLRAAFSKAVLFLKFSKKKTILHITISFTPIEAEMFHSSFESIFKAIF